jgi:8-oxo-dGTP diphosphatase
MLPYKISVLVFLQDGAGRQLLMLRAKAPNAGLWSPIGGKLEMGTGESPFQCAIREVHEEVGLTVSEKDLHLFAMIAERAYEGSGHWLMFLFRCTRPLEGVPPEIEEGRFGFFARHELETLPLPATDRSALWPIFDQHREGFVALRADCDPGGDLAVTIEQVLPGPARC